MLTAAEVTQLAHEHGVGEHVEDLLGRVRSGWRLEPGEAAPTVVGTTKIGGDPDLAEGEEWPLNARGVRMTFLAQVATAQLAPPDEPWPPPEWRHEGRFVRFFADLVDSPFEPCAARLLMTDPSVTLTRTPAPPVPDPWPEGGPWDDLDVSERFIRLPEVVITPVPFLSAPETHPVLKPDLHDYSEAADRYDAWAAALRLDGNWGEDDEDDADFDDLPPRAPWEIHHLLGEASSVQNDVRAMGSMITAFEGGLFGVEPDPALAPEDAWRVLLAVRNDERIDLEILDGGAFHVLVPVHDLAAGRYDRAVCAVDSG